MVFVVRGPSILNFSLRHCSNCTFFSAFDADKRRTQLTRLQTSVDNIPIIMTGVSSFLVIPILAGLFVFIA